MIESMELHVPEMRKSAGKGFTAATDVADYLAKKGMPFRQATKWLVSLCCIARSITRAGRPHA